MTMKLAKGMQERGIVVGNTYDKYGSRNPLVRTIMRQFSAALSQLVTMAAPQTIHEVGCGEGFWVMEWARRGTRARGSDFSPQVIALAKANAKEGGITPDAFAVRDIYDLTPDTDSADLIVCCEVLEHLEDPAAALRVLQGIVGQYLIVSVPREPLWRILNLARGKYLTDLGNTPGHLQHWSKRGFMQFVSEYFEIVACRSPLPWTLLLCRPRG